MTAPLRSRRSCLAALVGSALLPAMARGARRGPPTILLRSGWQTVNIGDIAHTPGVLAVLEEHLPGARLILWSKALDRGVAAMLRRRFPALAIVRHPGHEPVAADPTLDEALDRADFLLHGSGPSVVGAPEIRTWRDRAGKPYGLIGVTVPTVDDELRDLLDGAAFVFTRETTSLGVLGEAGVRGPALDFVPDGTFAFDLRDEAAADATLEAHGLRPGEFLCAVPRLRYTPYWKIRPGGTRPEVVAAREAENDRHVGPDHAKLREALAAWVRRTGGKVLACPEMTYQVDLLGPLLVDPQPADVRDRFAVLGRYWLPDEAASVYGRSAGVVSLECHSPILALAAGTPAVHLRQPTDTAKAQMYRDLGLGDWLLEIEAADGPAIAGRIDSITADPAAARDRARRAVALAAERFERGVRALASAVPG